ncbi:hypothetical protein Avbf_16019 [Armadillidium vulgare]|nr:hypothetical protein Avbf_16019 [Armadillidium vulgare]
MLYTSPETTQENKGYKNILHSESSKQVSKLAEKHLGSVYSLSAIRRGVSNQNTVEYCTDKNINV